MQDFEGLTGKIFGVVVSAVTLHDAATLHDQSILFLRRSLTETFLPGSWALPAGKVKPGEDPKEAVLRELHEEAGITGEVRDYIGVSWFDSTYYGRELQSIQHNYIVTTDDPVINLLDGSNTDYLWVPVSELDDPPIVFDDFTRGVINQAINSWRGSVGPWKTAGSAV
jgi:8-oxo-dGTP diphosphatase